MDKPAERLTREKQFWVRVPIGAIFTRYTTFTFKSSWLLTIGVGWPWHTWAQAQVKFLKVVDFFNRFNCIASFFNKVNKISNMTLWFLKRNLHHLAHTLALNELWLINITLQIIFNMIIKNCIRFFPKLTIKIYMYIKWTSPEFRLEGREIQQKFT